MSGTSGVRHAAQQRWPEVVTEPPAQRKANRWSLTSAAFEQLLAALDVDRERAGIKYRQLHFKLLKFFEWQGSSRADQQADEVIDRLTRRIAMGEQIENLHAYAHGVAKLLLLEARKELTREQQAHRRLLSSVRSWSDPRAEDLVEADEDLRQQQCFDNCLETLTGKNRSIILGYYAGERKSKIEGRRKLAETLGTDLNALRVRAYRIRGQLEGCVSQCSGTEK